MSNSDGANFKQYLNLNNVLCKEEHIINSYLGICVINIVINPEPHVKYFQHLLLARNK